MTENLSIEELCNLCGGEDFWHSHAVAEANIPSMMMSDGPHGLRKQDEQADHLGIHDSIKAICFPSASCLASSFDKDVAFRMGRLLGEEARAEGVHILLGPAINIKRSPLCGRNFEYFSEDPYLTGELASQMVKGIQSAGVGACVKHFAANNQENGRMVLSANIDERTLREIYLRAFERVVQESPRAIMSSYNKVNGEYVGESRLFLNDILRSEWGFSGIVISDWYAVNDRVKSILAGLDLEMPGGVGISTNKLIDGAKDINVKNAIIESAERIAQTARDLCLEKTEPYNKEEHHNQAVEFAEESAVLLKNENIFPIDKNKKILIIGELAKKPRFQGGGSSHINAYRVDNVIENLNCNFDYFQWDEDLQKLKKYLTQNSNNYEKVIIFDGLSDECESEGYDRLSIDLPMKTNLLIDLVAKYMQNIGVVLFNGSPVAMPWINQVKGALLMGLGGEGVGKACANLIEGKINPSGRLAESYPLILENNPSFLNSINTRNVDYAEGVFVGYRYYTTKKIPTLFPFGHGLSYTKFEYTNLKIKRKDSELTVTVDVKNIGNLFGKETVQLYISPPDSCLYDRPIAELRGFEKISLNVGERKTVVFILKKNDFAYFDNSLKSWRVDSGDYRVIIGRSAEKEALSISINIEGDNIPPIIDDNVTIGELLNCSSTAMLIKGMFSGYSSEAEGEAIGSQMKRAMLLNAPLRLVKGIAKLDDKSYQDLKNKLKELINKEIN